MNSRKSINSTGGSDLKMEGKKMSQIIIRMLDHGYLSKLKRGQLWKSQKITRKTAVAAVASLIRDAQTTLNTILASE